MTTFALTMLLLLMPSPTIDYTTAKLERRLKAVRVVEKIIIDGNLSELAWNQAQVATDFIQSEPVEEAPASEKTDVRILYDDDNLYIGAFAHDAEVGRIVVDELKKDFNLNAADTFTVVFDTFHDQRNGYQFTTNPAGAKADAQMTNEGREINTDWDGVWFVKTRIVEGGWVAEMAVPFKTLKFRDTDLQTWGINFQRKLRRRNEDSYWSPIPRIYNLQRVSLAGTLEDLEGLKPGANIKLKPSFSTSWARAQNGTSKETAEFGFDAKYGLTSGITWDFTYNTDFSQVEADEQQINLTRFSLFFPEKRDFFLENSGIFQFGSCDGRGSAGGGMGSCSNSANGGAGRQNSITNDMVFFFSRRIGLSDDGGSIPILGGTRLTGRAGSYELGFLNIEQKELGLANAANFTVGRLRRNILANSDIGFMMTNKEVLNSPYFNRVMGADVNFRFGRALSINSYIAKSSTPAGGSRNLAGRTSMAYIKDKWQIRSSFTSVQENFINDMGFVPRLGLRKFLLFGDRTVRPESLKKIVRNISFHDQIEYDVNRNGQLETRYIDYHMRTTFQNGGSMEIGVGPSLERLLKPFAIKKDVAIAPGVYSYNEYFITGNTDASRKLSVNFRYNLGPFYDGYRHTYQFGGRFRYNYKFNTSFNFSQNNISLLAGHFKANLLSTRVNYSFSTSVFLSAFLQYNNDAKQWSSNVRFNVIHRPLSDLFVVYNERRDSVSGNLIDRAVIGKLTYMISR